VAHAGLPAVQTEANALTTENLRSSNIDWLPENWPPRDWRQWAEASWTYLLDPPREAGPILCVSRGKLLVIAAGHVSNVLP